MNALPFQIGKLVLRETHKVYGGVDLFPPTFEEMVSMAKEIDEKYQEQAEHAKRVGVETGSIKRASSPTSASGSKPPKFPKKSNSGWGKSPGGRAPFSGGRGRGSGGRDQAGRFGSQSQGGRGSGHGGRGFDKNKGRGDGQNKKVWPSKDKKDFKKKE